jgi:hypothetical protein
MIVSSIGSMPVRRIEDGNRPIIDPEEIAGHFKDTLRKLFRPDEQCTGLSAPMCRTKSGF